MQKQRTIKEALRVSGVGLHTAQRVNLTLLPSPENTGIKFRRVDLSGKPFVEATPINILQAEKRLQRTALKKNNAEVHTIEHLMAALSGLGIDNVIIEADSAEMPGFDGSAKTLAEIIRNAGVLEQEIDKKVIELKQPVSCAENGASIEVMPDSKFSIEYYLEPKGPHLKNQSFRMDVNESGEFNRFFSDELAPSRTFCSFNEALLARVIGLGRGANFGNTLVMWRGRPIRNAFRFSNEPARHKALDLLGDLYLLGAHLRGRVIARKSGHKLNACLVKKIFENRSSQ